MIATLNTTLAEPLIEACSEGRFKDVAALLDSGADPNAGVEEMGRNGVRLVRPLTAIFRVVARGDTMPKIAQRQSHRIMQTLIEHGARIRIVEREVLIYAVRLGLPKTLQFLVEQGARAHRYAHELMENAILMHKLDCIDALASFGIDPNVRDQWGSTTFLDICAGNLRLEVRAGVPQDLTQRLGQLIEHGIDIHATDRMGTTALMRAVVSQQDGLMQALLIHKASAAPTLRNGVCAVHLAALSGSINRIRLIMAHADVRKDLERLNVKRLQPDVKAFLAAQPWAGQASQVA